MSHTLSQALRALRPDLNPAFDYMVADHLDGQGPRLTIWDEKKLGPRPSGDVIAAKMAEPYLPPIAPDDARLPAQKLAAFLAANPDVAQAVSDAATAIEPKV